MKHSLLFWSRKSHCWAGVYLSAVTLLWLGEMALLPAVYDRGSRLRPHPPPYPPWEAPRCPYRMCWIASVTNGWTANR